MKERIVKSYVDKLTINDIKNFGYQNDIILSDNEYNYLLNMIKNNWYIIVFGNPNNLFNELKNNVSDNNYKKIMSLYQIYKNKYINYL